MTHREAQALLDKIVAQVFGYKNPFTLEAFMQKFAFDIRLPQEVTDAVDGKPTWALSTSPVKFVRMENAGTLEVGGASANTDGLRPKRPLHDLDDVINAWSEVNFTTAQRVKDSINVSESDVIMNSENVFRSQDIRKSKNILFSDGMQNCEFVAASQRNGGLSFGIRVEDSGDCTNCFAVSWSGKLTNCMFVHDSIDTQDSMFCTGVRGKRFCIANMQYTEAEYRKIRDMVVRWVLTN
ncbi:MAG TPA: hypothetical protein VIR03_01850 [Candidatus Saccharimonadales bacterium]